MVGSQAAGTGKMTECIACATEPNDFGSSVPTVWLQFFSSQKWVCASSNFVHSAPVEDLANVQSYS